MLTYLRKLFRGNTAPSVKSTALSDFVHSPSRKKKKVYAVAIERAADEQRKVVERHRDCA